ncbi:MAG: NAD(P)H-dependent oxidoreductase subunit E [Alphaproteobacteria bacterium]|jgi:NADH-quinone oxidoreductase E subunit|nr:NAD(P)H-dependent oxidoreductase subunit E [Alphaproteobacteria bacterium]
MSAEFSFSEENKKLAQDILKKYPESKRFSAIMPLLTMAQNQNGGFLTEEVIDHVAKYLGVATMSVAEVANFYSMYNLNPVGKYLIQTCNSVVCCMKGSDELHKYAKEITGTLNSNVSADGLFSVKKVECLGACSNAIAVKINDTFVEEVTKESLAKQVADLKNGLPLEEKFIVRKSLLEE